MGTPRAQTATNEDHPPASGFQLLSHVDRCYPCRFAWILKPMSKRCPFLQCGRNRKGNPRSSLTCNLPWPKFLENQPGCFCTILLIQKEAKYKNQSVAVVTRCVRDSAIRVSGHKGSALQHTWETNVHSFSLQPNYLHLNLHLLPYNFPPLRFDYHVWMFSALTIMCVMEKLVSLIFQQHQSLEKIHVLQGQSTS